MNNNAINKCVNESIKNFKEDIENKKNVFFTENDLICFFYKILFERMKKKKCLFHSDKNDIKQLIIHREYPTPFRCSMKDYGFKEKKDNESKYRRGHYDLVILNPGFIKRNSYDVIKGYDFKQIKIWREFKHQILWGFEFMFNRRARDGIVTFKKSVMQDFEKLKYSKDEEYCKNIKMIVVVNRDNEKVKKIKSIIFPDDSAKYQDYFLFL